MPVLAGGALRRRGGSAAALPAIVSMSVMAQLKLAEIAVVYYVRATLRGPVKTT